jgi:endonuclease/exonuclease/phosphatase family metal-dependent hydrolase
MRSLLVAVTLLALGACEDRPQIYLDMSPEPDLDATQDIVGPPGPDITVGPAVTLTLATYNVRDFFDATDDPAHQDELPAAAEVDAKVKKLGAALRELKADVLALQEVENIAMLQRLNTEVSTLGYKEARLVPGNDMRGINVALLSRYPVVLQISHKNDTFLSPDGGTTKYGFSRDCLEMTIEPSQGRRLILLINHFAADDGSADAETRRHAQAARVRQIVDAALKNNPAANLAVVGDLNDQPGTKTLTLITGGTPALYDATSTIASADRWTHIYSGKKEQLDYVLLAPGLKDDLVSGSPAIPHTTTFKDASDHYPISAKFTLK